MLTSDRSSDRRKTAVLIVEGPPGVELQVLDGSLDLVARGSTKMRLRLQEGVYLVKWIANGKTYQEFHRLLPLSAPLRVPKETLPSEISSGVLTDPPMADASPSSWTQSRPWMSGEAEIVIFVSGAPADTAEQDIYGLRLFNHADIAMRSDPDAVAFEPLAIAEGGGRAERVYRVPRGDYRVRYVAASGEAVEQPVPALAGRRTLVFLRAVVATSLIADGDEYRPINRQGVNPAATRVVSVPAQSSARENADLIRLAELIQHALVGSASPLDVGTIAQLEGREADPLLKISAAAFILLRLEQGLEPGLENEVFEHLADIPSESVAPTGFAAAIRPLIDGVNARFQSIATQINSASARNRDARWRKRAARLVAAADPQWALTDAIVLGWRLADVREAWASAPPVSLTNPPMLDCCWRWAVAWSAATPSAVPNTRTIRAPSRGRLPAGPWLAWRASAGKELALDLTDPELEVPTKTDTDGLPRLVESLNQAAATMEGASQRYRGVAQGLFSTLSTETRRVIANTESLDFGGRDAAEKLLSFTQSLTAPASVVADQIEAASREVSGAPPENRSVAEEPPAFAMPILVSDDPNKGRFGGAASRYGFTLRATFGVISANWIEVSLSVSADQDSQVVPGMTVEFFLHDTFRPNRFRTRFEENAARLKFRAWGGFTVGAWIPDHCLELELDLADLPDAPPAIRDL